MNVQQSNEFINELKKIIANIPDEIIQLDISLKANEIVTMKEIFYATDNKGDYVIQNEEVKTEEAKYKLVKIEPGDL